MLYLTKEEERMLQGDCGLIISDAMKLLVTLGDVFDAKRMVEIKSAHASGVSYKNIGDPGLEFLEEWASEGALTRVPTTINPCGMDRERWRELGINEAFASKQMKIINAFKKMKTTESLSCTPYLIGNKPKTGEHIAWSESSALTFANSILGARTNREGGPTALASALTGISPFFGYHLEEQREPTHEICVEKSVKGALEYSSLGYFLGQELGQCIPFFKGLIHPSLEDLKALSAGIATSGAIALYHVDNITPGNEVFREEKYERINVTKTDLAETTDKLSNGETYEHICIGCPHCSMQEIAEIANRVVGKKLNQKLWVFTSKAICEASKRKGYFSIIEKAGGKIISDTCMVVSPMREMNVNGIVTNSCKAAHYIPSNCKIPATLKSIDNCIEDALKK